MNKRQLTKLIGTTVKLRPRPQRDGKYVPDERNKWHVLEETEDKKGLALKNVLTNHEFVIAYDNINQYRSPDLILLRGQPILKGEQTVIVEPFIDAPDDGEHEESPEILADRFTLAEAEIQKLTPAEKVGLRELLVRGKMTDTDISSFLISKQLGSYPEFYKSVSAKTSFLDREFSGYNTVIPVFKSVLMRLLNQQNSSS